METMSPNHRPEMTLLSPDFTPRPGWGGRLSAWFKAEGRTVLLRLLILAGIPVLVAPLLNRSEKLLTPVASPAPRLSPIIVVPVPAGDGITHAVRLALYEYLALQPVSLAMEPDQFLFAETWLTRHIGIVDPSSGQEIHFPHDLLAAAILRAQRLSPQERAAWSRYVR